MFVSSWASCGKVRFFVGKVRFFVGKIRGQGPFLRGYGWFLPGQCPNPKISVRETFRNLNNSSPDARGSVYDFG